jgi:hypothetical protein
MATCFVSLPSGSQFDGYYKHILAPAATRAGLDPVRAQEIGRPHAFEQIWIGLHTAAACLVDLTGLNFNVLYVLGLAHAWDKPLVQIVQSTDELPFDLKFTHHILYRPGAARWEDMFSMQVQAALREFATA